MDGSEGTLAGRYQLGEVIGRGGMGAVYRAVDLRLGRTVAVKLLPGALAEQDPTRVARFEREARAAASLNHPAVVAVYDTGVDEGARFIVMELIEGRSLEQVMRDEGPLESGRAARIGAEVADALAAAHAAGIVHRDIKPANVMVAADGSVKVLDFGIARAQDSTTLTGNAAVLGTASYMSPEQAMGRPADERSDIYSLGCVLYALLAGRAPFQGESPAAVLHQHANLEPPSLRVANGGIAPELDTVVHRMLAKSPEARPQTAAEVRDLLARPLAGPLANAYVDPSAATTRLLVPERARSSHRGLAVGAIVAVAAAIAVVVLLAAGGGGSPRAAAHHSRGSTRPTDTTKTTKTTNTTKTNGTTNTAGTTTTATSQGTTTTSAVTSTSSAPPTVSGTAGALTALITNDAQSGAIDQQAAQQLGNGLSDILNSYEQGHTPDIQHKLANLSQQLSQLQQHGDITSGAAPALVKAVGSFATALASAPAPTTSTAGGPPPGHGPDGKGPAGGGPAAGD